MYKILMVLEMLSVDRENNMHYLKFIKMYNKLQQINSNTYIYTHTIRVHAHMLYF